MYSNGFEHVPGPSFEGFTDFYRLAVARVYPPVRRHRLAIAPTVVTLMRILFSQPYCLSTAMFAGLRYPHKRRLHIYQSEVPFRSLTNFIDSQSITLYNRNSARRVSFKTTTLEIPKQLKPRFADKANGADVAT